ncbi:hypothetical protein APY94_04610 [Thermococcus celericrescens]|uniref:Uncharacterized protein n=1 Tax=Thermococcus celericrescens TaxID=227598 RepID=A0A117ITV8_9EURY|nr:hypothetical protein [Thermococcus celericrescens]KUH33808.1 hypothetical protein APY94_04610 [Thermococcus celericrescens]
MPYRDMRASYESVVLPLLFLGEENMAPPNETLEFIASLFEKTQYSGDATLRLSFEGTVNYTVEEIAYWTNGWKVIESWKGTGRNIRVKIKPENSRGEIKFLIRSTRPLLSNESGIFKGNMRLYLELPENYISFIGEGYPRKSVFQFNDGKSYAVIESPYFDASWNHDVYSTAIALIWLYLAGKDEKSIGEAPKFLELASPGDDMSFDGDAYALIAPSLYGGKWESDKPGAVKEKPSSSSRVSWKLPVVFAIGLLIGALLGIKIGRTESGKS